MNTHEKSEENSFAVFAAGCFWCIEAIFQRLKGVNRVVPGYAGGTTFDPTYQEVCKGNTNHAEVVGVYFDPKKISYERLLEVFWSVHDPTTLNRQGNDVGTQYRSAILYTSGEQKRQAITSMEKFERQDPRSLKYTTEIMALKNFYPAEEYHKNYYNRNSDQVYCSVQITPKIKKIQNRFPHWFKEVY